MTRIVFDVTGFHEATERFAAVGDRARNAKPLFESLADDFLDVEAELFRSQGARARERWKALAPGYLQEKLEAGHGSRIMEIMSPKGGRLRRSLTVKGAQYQVRRVRNNGMIVGTNLGIAKIHQRGGMAPVEAGPNAGRMYRIPRRRLIHVPDRDVARWNRTVLDWLISGNTSTPRMGL